jgi:hypothetical protein
VSGSSAVGGDRRMRGALLVGMLILLAAAFAIGRLTAPAEESDQAQAVAVDPGAELNTAYPHSRTGAALAMAAYQRALADPAILRPGVLKKRIEAIATPDYAPKMLEANQPGTNRLMAGPVGEGVRSGTPTAYFGVPIAYRTISYTPERARIQNWGFTMLGNVSTVEPAAYFGTGTMELVWQEGRWKVASTQGAFGPSPETRTPQDGAEGFELQDLARDFHPYGIAP